MKLKWTLSDSGTWAVASCAGHVVTAMSNQANGWWRIGGVEVSGICRDVSLVDMQEAAEAALARLLAEDEGLRALLDFDDTLGAVANALGVPLADRPEGIEAAAKAWRERAEAAEAAQRWISVSERPLRRTVAEVCRLGDDGWAPAIGVYVAHGPGTGWYINRAKCDELITHYRPLGPGPEVNE